MSAPIPCARCGAALDPGEAPAVADAPILLADLCLDCLDAVWDAVMTELQTRRRGAIT